MDVDKAAEGLSALMRGLDSELDALLKPTLKAKPKKAFAEKLRARSGGGSSSMRPACGRGRAAARRASSVASS
jgi:hypothetical protein